MRRFSASMSSTILILAACGAGPVGGGSVAVDGAQAFYGLAGGEVAFAVLRSPHALGGGAMSAESSDPGPDRIRAEWLAADGGVVRIVASPRGPGEGTLVIDGVHFDLADGNVFALRRRGGATGALQVEARELTREGLATELAAVLARRPELRGYLGLDDPPPVRLSLADTAPGEAWTVEIANVSDRDLGEVSFRVFERDASGALLGPSARISVAFLSGETLEPARFHRASVPRDPRAASAAALPTRAVFADGTPETWSGE